MSSLPPSVREPVYYAPYLQLERLLDCQSLESKKYGPAAHDEMLFIITHQAYELWFKQILHELQSVIEVFQQAAVPEKDMGTVIHRLARIKTIQRLLLMQIDVIETMTPLDFLEFRNLLVPASGFQSVQFKQIEIMLGLRRSQRTAEDQGFFRTRLTADEQAVLTALEATPSLFDLTDYWLSRMPFLKFGEFDFWKHYGQAVERMLEADKQIIQQNTAISDSHRRAQLDVLDVTRTKLGAILDEHEYNCMRANNEVRLQHSAFLAALFIHLYRDEPMMYLPFRYLTLLVEIDGQMTTWRARHALMVQRMLGTKIGTGGSSGHEYLVKTTDRNRVYLDLYNLSTFLLPRSALPPLPEALTRAMSFHRSTG
ncbi:MAG TPA: tryptophan 2,3-dioxygenase family protein [Pirellulaceae bacterium]|nr:tryptophan 2,3-dioxygenase family protein [Pirellulaceae bacterium]